MTDGLQGRSKAAKVVCSRTRLQDAWSDGINQSKERFDENIYFPDLETVQNMNNVA